MTVTKDLITESFPSRELARPAPSIQSLGTETQGGDQTPWDTAREQQRQDWDPGLSDPSLTCFHAPHGSPRGGAKDDIADVIDDLSG